MPLLVAVFFLAFGEPEVPEDWSWNWTLEGEVDRGLLDFNSA